jgi:hypothetical protein
VRSYWIKAVLGLVLFLGGLAAFEYGLYELMQIGTCASGGPYLSARTCPAGTAGKVLLLPVGLIVGTIGIVVFAMRGRRPGASDDATGLSAGLLGWSGLFVVTGIVALLASVGPGAHPGPGAKWVGVFLCGLFVPMGAVPLVAARRGRREREEWAPVMARALAQPAPVFATPPRAAAAAASTTTGDPVDRLRKLGQLRDTGLISAIEFDRAKARILAEI